MVQFDLCFTLIFFHCFFFFLLFSLFYFLLVSDGFSVWLGFVVVALSLSVLLFVEEFGSQGRVPQMSFSSDTGELLHTLNIFI